MREARWSRVKDDADNKRTRGSILRAAISSASNERTSRLRERAALFKLTAAPGTEHRQSILRLCGGSSATRFIFFGSVAVSNGTHRTFCGSGTSKPPSPPAKIEN